MDAIGGGGGLITLPALLATGIAPHTALGTNKAQNIFGTGAALVTYWRAGAIDGKWARRAGPLGFCGALIGAGLTLAISPERMRPLVVAFLLVACALLLLPSPVAKTPKPALAWGIAIGIGCYDGFFGPGTGALLIAGFTTLAGMTMTQATAHAKVVNGASNLGAICIFAASGHIDLTYVLPMAGVQLCGGHLGARLALRGGAALIRRFVLAVAAVLIVRVSGTLLGYW